MQKEKPVYGLSFVLIKGCIIFNGGVSFGREENGRYA